MKYQIIEWLFRIIFAIPFMTLGIHFIGQDASVWIYLCNGAAAGMMSDIFTNSLKEEK